MFSYKREEKRNCRVENGIEVCGSKKSYSYSIDPKQFKFGLFGLLGFWGVISLASFFYGWGSGGFDVGMKWGGYTLALCLISIGFFVPVLGIVMAATYTSITGNLMSLAGITANYWIDTINTVVLVVGIVLQVIVLIAIVASILFLLWMKSN